MKAVLYDAPKSFAVPEALAPEPGAGELFIGVRPAEDRDDSAAEVPRRAAIIYPAHARRS